MQAELEQLKQAKQREEEQAATRAQAAVETVASQQELAAKGIRPAPSCEREGRESS